MFIIKPVDLLNVGMLDMYGVTVHYSVGHFKNGESKRHMQNHTQNNVDLSLSLQYSQYIRKGIGEKIWVLHNF